MMQRQNLIAVLAYGVAAAVLAPFLLFYVNNPDAFQYINVSKLYLAGNFQEAINGYWSPLFCWILTQFMMTGMNSIIAMKLLQLAIGFFALSSWLRITDKIIDHKFFRGVLKLAAVPYLLCYAYLNLTADLLFFSIALFLLHFLIVAPIWNSLKRSIQFGLLGALLYLGKSFGLPLFIVLAAVSLDRERRLGMKVVPNYVGKGILVFLTISLSWITLISLKYDRLTISEAARFNRTKEVAPLPGVVSRLPVLSDGLSAPAGNNAISAWEEPLQSVVLTPLHPLSFGRDFVYVAKVVGRNIASIWYYDFKRQPGVLFLVFVILALAVNHRFFQRSNARIFYPLVFLFAFYGGYSAILVHTRYTWICTWIMLLLSTRIILLLDEHPLYQQIRKRMNFLPALREQHFYYGRRALWGLLLLLAMKRPLKELFFTQDTDKSVRELAQAALHPVQTLKSSYRDDRETYLTSKFVARHHILNGPVASRYSENPFRHRYSSSHQLASQSAVKYFGQLDDRREGALDTLRSRGVQYFLVWDAHPDSLFGQPPVYRTENVAVFSVR